MRERTRHDQRFVDGTGTRRSNKGHSPGLLLRRVRLAHRVAAFRTGTRFGHLHTTCCFKVRDSAERFRGRLVGPKAAFERLCNEPQCTGAARRSINEAHLCALAQYLISLNSRRDFRGRSSQATAAKCQVLRTWPSNSSVRSKATSSCLQFIRKRARATVQGGRRPCRV